MKIEGTCDRCGRTFLLSQIGPQSDSPGRCPFCGAKFARHYGSTLVDAAYDAEIAARRFLEEFNRLRSMEDGFKMDVEGLLADLKKRIREHEQLAR